MSLFSTLIICLKKPRMPYIFRMEVVCLSCLRKEETYLLIEVKGLIRSF